MTGLSRTRVAIVLVLVFLAGLATGVFGGAWHARHAFVGRHGAGMGDRMREHLQHRLNLTPEQLAQMNPVLDQMTKQLQEIRAESGRRVAETMSQAHEQLAAHLNPEQQAELRRMQERHKGMMHRHWQPEHLPPPAAP